MSQENVEVVREYVDVWNAGDMEGVRELYDPDAVMEVAADWPEPGPFVGRDAVMHQLNQARNACGSRSIGACRGERPAALRLSVASDHASTLLLGASACPHPVVVAEVARTSRPQS